MITIIGSGLTGLSAAYYLSKSGQEVTILEKEDYSGGMASSFRPKGWNHSLEKGYHHWFTNDKHILNLAREINHPVNTYSPRTDIFYKNKLYKFDDPISIFIFPFLTLYDKLRLLSMISFLKIIPFPLFNKQTTALKWIRKVAGKKNSNLIWKPLLVGKFGELANSISVTWFWARIKKRTAKLSYPVGGYFSFTESLVKKLKSMGVKFYFKTDITKIISRQNIIEIKTSNKSYYTNKLLVTVPTPIFAKFISHKYLSYKKKLSTIKYLNAQIMVLELDECYMDKTYWVNILEKDFPFLVIVEHTNFVNMKNYGNKHLLYIGNYLPNNHKYLKYNKERMLKIFLPYLKKINSDIDIIIKRSYLFNIPFAQPVVDINFRDNMPNIKTDIPNIYLANIDMIYPWDRGTNYAVELGNKVTSVINNDE